MHGAPHRASPPEGTRPPRLTRRRAAPSPLHYVRNHGACPKLDWATHRIEVKGNVRRKLSISMDELVKMPSYSFPCLLVCAGNRRKEQNMIKKSIGFNWGPCATATSWWTGVRLADILKRAGVTKAGPGRRFVCFAGPQRELPQTYDGQQGGPGSYGTSIDIETALDPACDIMVAYKQNGELLHPDHGFPVRLLIPGYIGGRMIKWLCEIEVTDEESNNFYHFNDNRVLPVGVDVERANREGWWFKPEYIINELNINAAIAYPAHGETISAAKPSYKLQGYAYSGGGRKVTRVEVSLDQGQSWQLAEVTVREKPRWGKGVSGAKAKWWCWCFWELAVPVKAIAGANEICLRAWDEAQNSMPDTPTWNVMGMMNNPWYRVRVHSAGHGILRFEHPTQAGPDKEEGWMVQMAQKAPDGVLNWGWGGKGGPAAPPRPDLSPA